MKASVLIVEDNIKFAEETSKLLESNNYKVVGIANDPISALRILKKEKPDLVLTEINLSHEMDGIQLVHIIKNEYKIPFLYVTGHNDEEILERVRKTKPWGYVLKPHTEKELLVSIELALYKARDMQKNPEKKVFDKRLVPVSEYLFLKKNTKRLKVHVNEIRWIEAESNYSNIITDDGIFTASMSLKEFEQKTDFDNLMRVHRKYIVNIDRIDAITYDHILIDEANIPIGKYYKPLFRKKLRML